MKFGIRKKFKILAPGNSLRKRVAYSLAIARFILVPVIFLAVYYLFEMGWIVDRIVNVDAPAATLAQQASIETLEARRAERNYLLLRDPAYLAANRESLGKTKQILSQIQELEPQDMGETQKALEALGVYEQRLAAAVAAMGQPGLGDADRIQAVVRAYEKDLNDLLRGAKVKKREQLIEELRNRVGSFDTQITETVQEGNPALAPVTEELQSSIQEVLGLLTDLETENWKRVESDHREARRLLRQAEWALSIVSAITLLFSVWVSFILPRQVVKPLISLREAVDHAAQGDNAIELEIEGRGEVADLARSVHNLIVRLRQSA
ncbi:MAG TPA: HAMP domain-containing protein [Candidatus Acidoferrum sp.]|jgi:methyl-accepting chemotaxis protein|nr:HAMP domain-containing protein [Candidatus Acidoferrum sp.]